MLPIILLLTMFQLPQREATLCAKTAEALPSSCGDDFNTNISADGLDYVCTWTCVGNQPTKWELDSVTMKRKKKTLPPEVRHDRTATIFINRQAAVRFGPAWEKETREGLTLCASTVPKLPASCPSAHDSQWMTAQNGQLFTTRPKRGVSCHWACTPEKMDDPNSYWGIRAGPWSLDTMGYDSPQ